MTEPKTPEDFTDIEDMLGRLPKAPWFVSDCEGEVQVWQESALRRITRDEHGEITGYSTPSSYDSSSLLYERSLDTWDRDEEYGEDDDLRRDVAEFLAACRNRVPALLADNARLQRAVELLGSHLQGGSQTFVDALAEAAHLREKLADRDQTIAGLMADRDELRAELNGEPAVKAGA
ncbi:hypothetical protein AB0B89_23795 [Sphaerisporangium sp. NPDC049002]|uniref:hypothetical protein n=1 Tax=Sphaerisporangium sp. NPDC049002 TaxID=3155392 RepID=UPI0033D4C8A8